MDQCFYEDAVGAQDADWAEEVGEDFFDDTVAQGLKHPERVAYEKKFLELYESYMHPQKPISAYRRQCQLEDLYVLLTKINRGWVASKCARYRSAGFHEADRDEATFSGGVDVCLILQKDQQDGNYSAYPVGHYLNITRHKIIDQYFRPKFKRLPPRRKEDLGDPQKEKEWEEKVARQKESYPVSLESMTKDDKGAYREDWNRALAVDPFGEMRRPRWESDQKSNQLSVLYLRELMDYPDEPQKPLAVMYGSVLYQLAKEREGSKLADVARKSTKLTSPPWAHQAMGNYTLEQLGNISEKIVSRAYRYPLVWGQDFRAHMPQPSGYDPDRLWGEIVYTAVYTQDQTSNWIESIFRSSMSKSARKLVADSELREFAEDNLSSKAQIHKAVAKIEKKKEASR